MHAGIKTADWAASVSLVSLVPKTDTGFGPLEGQRKVFGMDTTVDSQRVLGPEAGKPSMPLHEDAYLRLWQIIGDKKRGVPPLVPVSAATWWAWCARGKAPKPLKLGPRTTVWRASEIKAFLSKESS